MHEIKFKADGVDVEVCGDGETGDVYLKIDDNESVIFSPLTARILALALQNIAETDPKS